MSSTCMHIPDDRSTFITITLSGNWQGQDMPLGLFTKERITFRKLFRNTIRTLSWFESLILPFVNTKLFKIRLLKREKIGVSDRDPHRKPDSEDMWTQSSFGTWFVRVHFGNARWNHACVSQRGLCSRNKILPRSAQILFMIGPAFAFACERTYSVVQITNPIGKRIAIRNGFRNVIHSFVNRPFVFMINPQARTWLLIWSVINLQLECNYWNLIGSNPARCHILLQWLVRVI